MSSKIDISTTSFTNKDFNSAYPELLDLASNMSSNWDPNITNESDPGIVLLKEMALMIDKINYSSDKNALETMPLSVTLEKTSRQLFLLLGYYPKWYLGAEIQLSIGLNLKPNDDDNNPIPYNEGYHVVVPAFTMVSDEDGNYIYTIPQKIDLTDDNILLSVTAILGTVQSLSVDNDSIITVDYLDENNRIYFSDTLIAQNGIFIYNTLDSENVTDQSLWTRVDNLAVQELGNKFFSFGVDSQTGNCYIEFPQDAADVMSDGVYIKYLITDGADGMTTIGNIAKLYNSSVDATYSSTGEDVSISTDYFYISNTDLLEYGLNIETINDSYNNYQRVKGTFDTLVTTKDYSNAIYNTGKVSNGFVCDRTNDILQSFKIVHSGLSDVSTQLNRQLSREYETTDINSNNLYEIHRGEYLKPFELKVYAMQYNDDLNTSSVVTNRINYNNTFELYTDLEVEDDTNIDSSLYILTLLLNENKCILHNFKNIQSNKPCLIKNVAEISFTIFPTIQLTSLQITNLKTDVLNQIFAKYNAHELTIGDSIDFNLLKLDLSNSNDLIKNIALNPINYYTYVVYYSENEIYEDFDGNKYFLNNLTSEEDIKKYDNKWRSVCISDEVDYVKCLYDSETDKYYIYDSNTGTRSTIDVTELYKNKSFYILDYNEVNDYYGEESGLSRYWLVYNVSSSGKITPFSRFRNEFRNDIEAKCILAGKSALYKYDSNEFKYLILEENNEYKGKSIEILPEMIFKFEGGDLAIYELNDNETIHLVKPEMTDSITYGSYVRYDYVGKTIEKESSHKLTDKEKLVIYYKTTDDETAPYVKAEYGSGYIILPSFTLYQTTESITYVADATTTPSTTQIANASQSINIQEKNEVRLSNTYNYVYVVGNEDKENNRYKLTLLKESTGKFSHTLGINEYFIYTNSNKSVLNIMGSGTKISVDPGSTYKESTYEILNEVIPLKTINKFGLSALKDDWNELKNIKITVLAQEQKNVIDSGSSMKMVTTGRLMPAGVDIKLTKDGFFYVFNGTDISNQLVTAVSGSCYNDEGESVTITSSNLTTNYMTDFFFSSSYYSQSLNTSFLDDLEFESLDYATETILYLSNGVVTSLTGIYSDNYNVTSSTSNHYMIPGVSGSTSIYKVKKDGNNLSIFTISKTYLNLSSVDSVDHAAETDVYTLKVNNMSNPERYNNSIYHNTDDDTYKVYSVDYVSTASGVSTFTLVTSDSIEEILTTPANIKLYLTWDLADVSCNYDSSVINAESYKDFNGTIVSSLSPSVKHIKLKWLNEKTQSYVLQPIILLDYLSDDILNVSTITAISNPVTLTRNWKFLNSNGSSTYISEDSIRTKLFLSAKYNEWFADLTIWPKSDPIKLSISSDYVQEGGKASPELFDISYKNSGDDDYTDVPFGNDDDLRYSVGGYVSAYLSQDEPLILQDNWTVNLTYLDSDDNENTIAIKNNGSSGDGTYKLYSSKDIQIEDFYEVSLSYEDENDNVCYPTILCTLDKSQYNSTLYSSVDNNCRISKNYTESKAAADYYNDVLGLKSGDIYKLLKNEYTEATLNNNTKIEFTTSTNIHNESYNISNVTQQEIQTYMNTLDSGEYILVLSMYIDLDSLKGSAVTELYVAEFVDAPSSSMEIYRETNDGDHYLMQIGDNSTKVFIYKYIYSSSNGDTSTEKGGRVKTIYAKSIIEKDQTNKLVDILLDDVVDIGKTTILFDNSSTIYAFKFNKNFIPTAGQILHGCTYSSISGYISKDIESPITQDYIDKYFYYNSVDDIVYYTHVDNEKECAINSSNKIILPVKTEFLANLYTKVKIGSTKYDISVESFVNENATYSITNYTSGATTGTLINEDYYNLQQLSRVYSQTELYTYSIGFPKSKSAYALKIKNYQDISELSIKLNDTIYTKKLNVKDSDDLSERGVYYIVFITTTETSSDITIDLKSRSCKENEWYNVSGKKIILYPIRLLDDENSLGLKYKESDGTPNLDNSKNILPYILQLDKDLEFDYLYLPSDEEEIKKPLSSASFNNYNHPYNKYMIPQIRTYNVVSESNIIINN